MLRHRCGRGALQSPIYLEGPLNSAMSVSLGREPLTSLQAKDFASQRASTQVVRLPTVTPFRSSVIFWAGMLRVPNDYSVLSPG